MLVFTQQMECQFCAETRQIAEEVSKLSDSLLNSALETGRWDEELVAKVRKFQRTVKSVMIKVAALER